MMSFRGSPSDPPQQSNDELQGKPENSAHIMGRAVVVQISRPSAQQCERPMRLFRQLEHLFGRALVAQNSRTQDNSAHIFWDEQ